MPNSILKIIYILLKKFDDLDKLIKVIMKFNNKLYKLNIKI